jgi:hypothetical protein
MNSSNSQSYGQILVSGGSQAQLAALAAAHPGARLASRAVYSTEVAQNAQQNNFVDLLILGVIAALAAVTLVNTLVVSTVERRGRVRLLSGAGATTRQLAWSFGWQALFVTVLGWRRARPSAPAPWPASAAPSPAARRRSSRPARRRCSSAPSPPSPSAR